jgi:hypothetical protein
MSDEQERRSVVKSSTQRAEELDELYDHVYGWMVSLVETRNASGTCAVMSLLPRIRDELVAWRNDGVVQQDFNISFEIPGLDFSKYRVENSKDD